MDFGHIKRLVGLVESSGIDALEIRDGDFQISIVKHRQQSAQNTQSTHTVLSATPHEDPQSATHSDAIDHEHLLQITSPMVGTFYSAPAPDAEPYVTVGTTIQEGSTLCIIEAMKLMNEIEAEISGKIMKILVTSGQPVEYNQPLFLVDTGQRA